MGRGGERRTRKGGEGREIEISYYMSLLIDLNLYHIFTMSWTTTLALNSTLTLT